MANRNSYFTNGPRFIGHLRDYSSHEHKLHLRFLTRILFLDLLLYFCNSLIPHFGVQGDDLSNIGDIQMTNELFGFIYGFLLCIGNVSIRLS